MSLFSRLKALRGSSRRSARRRSPSAPRLEPLEARELLICQLPGPCSWYLSSLGSGTGYGDIDDPWRTIGELNAAIAGGIIRAGDTIHFRRGDNFVGNVVFGFGGTPASPITIQSYGVPQLPKPVIDAVDGSGISVCQAAGFKITDLEIKGSYGLPGGDSNGNGIEFVSATPLTPYEYVELTNLDVHGFAGYDNQPATSCANLPRPTGHGILIYAKQPTNMALARLHYRDIRIGIDAPEAPEVKVHANENSGISVKDSYSFTDQQRAMGHERVVISHVRAYDQVPRTDGGGFGIVLAGVEDGVVRRSRAYNNGTRALPTLNVGIYAYHSRHILFEYNESFLNKSDGADGHGFTFDQWTTSSIMQHNLAHDNDGSGYMIGGIGISQPMSLNSVLRYSISQNDSRYSAWGGILFENWTPSDVNVYGNTVYMSPNNSPYGPTAAVNFHSREGVTCNGCLPRINLYNNLLHTTSPDEPVVRLDPAFVPYADNVQFSGNDYFSGEDLGITILWGAQTDMSLAAFQERGQEVYNGSPVGASVNANLELIGQAPAIMNIDQMHVELVQYYQLQADTPTAVKTGGMNLFAGDIIGANWWWLGDSFWFERLGPHAHDGFDIGINALTLFSMGASQYPG